MVLDLFSGSGSAAIAALKMKTGLEIISVEKDETQSKYLNTRLQEETGMKISFIKNASEEYMPIEVPHKNIKRVVEVIVIDEPAPISEVPGGMVDLTGKDVEPFPGVLVTPTKKQQKAAISSMEIKKEESEGEGEEEEEEEEEEEKEEEEEEMEEEEEEEKEEEEEEEKEEEEEEKKKDEEEEEEEKKEEEEEKEGEEEPKRSKRTASESMTREERARKRGKGPAEPTTPMETEEVPEHQEEQEHGALEEPRLTRSLIQTVENYNEESSSSAQPLPEETQKIIAQQKARFAEFEGSVLGSRRGTRPKLTSSSSSSSQVAKESQPVKVMKNLPDYRRSVRASSAGESPSPKSASKQVLPKSRVRVPK
jgi:16S rRNA G966 N2-methylase RsmD